MKWSLDAVPCAEPQRIFPFQRLSFFSPFCPFGLFRLFRLFGLFDLLGLFFLFTSPLLAQEPTFTASVSGNTVAQNSVFEIQFELKNANSSDFQAPSFADFRVIAGPSTGSSMMSINGKVTTSQTWSYTLIATKQGKFIIGSASVGSGRKKLTTRPLTIEVVPPKEAARSGSASQSHDPVMLIAETDAKTYFPGQQIILTYRLLFRENIQTINTVTEDDYADFFVQVFNDFSRDPTYERINGVEFTSRIVKTMALFAHQSGTFTIDPMIMNVGIATPFPGQQGFFGMHRTQDIKINSVPVVITIVPLPQGAPDGFSGAVGQYSIRTSRASHQISTDDALTFQLEITGDGDSRRWDPPAPVINGTFETYAPKILEDKLTYTHNRVSHIRSIEYQMIPDAPGDYHVYVPLTYFDPDKKQYITAASDTISLHVTQGQNKPGAHPALQEGQSGPVALKSISGPWFNDRFWISVPHLFLFGLCFSGSCLGFVVAYKRKKESGISRAEKIRSAAGQHALSQLDLLAAAGESLQAKDFFERATEVYYKFLSARYSIPASELDESNLADYLSRAGTDREVMDRSKQFFNQCLTVRYGGIPGGFSREGMLQECREIVKLLGM